MILKARAAALAAVAAAMPLAAVAGPVSLLGEGGFGQSRGALIQARQERPEATGRSAFIPILQEVPERAGRGIGSSLFAGQDGASFFAPLPSRQGASEQGRRDLGAAIAPLGPDASHVERIRALIGHAESRTDGYDAINYGAKRLPSRRPTELTIGEIYRWIAATPGQPHAIGRYQFIPATLKRLVRTIGAQEQETFSPRLQDRLADELLREAGFDAFMSGLMPRQRFMNNLAAIWAGLPNSSGRSHYHGYAGNRATMTWAHFDAEMAKIVPG